MRIRVARRHELTWQEAAGLCRQSAWRHRCHRPPRAFAQAV